MMRPAGSVALVFALFGALMFAAPAAAQQSLSLNIGYFDVRGEGSRVAGDTIVANLDSTYPFALGYRVSDFNGVTFGAEWLFPLGALFEGGVGVNYFQHTVPSIYPDLQNQANGADITQDLKLRTVPITATFRFLPLGRRAPIQPFVGAGVAIIPWNYSENGDFVDASYSTFNFEYKDSGTAVGPVIFGGIRVPVSRAVAFGGEIRYQYATADLNPQVGFAGTKIDLGGITYQANIIFRF